MNPSVAALEPKPIWTHFESLNEVPRASKKEQRVVEFMREFGKRTGLETLVDDVGNVLIRKPATPGYEQRRPVVLQSHLDMVHQKNADTQFDFASQGIESYVDDGWVRARGTTLGADNGIGVAAIMAVLVDKTLKHGPVEGLFTIDEETGMTGAQNLKPDWLQGEILLNLDTEEHGELCIGCAGGIDTLADVKFPTQPTRGNQAFKITVKGLRGGHSGCDIHLGRGNSNKLLNRLLHQAIHQYEAELSAVDGGNLRNAIPREANATIVIAANQAAELVENLGQLVGSICDEYHRGEPDLKIGLEKTELPKSVLEPGAAKKWVQAIYAAPNGVYRMSEEMAGLVETSTSLARVHLENGAGTVEFLTRSSRESGKQDLTNVIHATFKLAGFNVKDGGGYNGWQPNKDSQILKIMRVTYEQLFGQPPTVNAVHAGLECGIIGSHYPQMDMISFGPTIRNPHSPDEQCEIASVKKFWDLLVATLEQIPVKK